MTEPLPLVAVPATCELWVDGARFADGSTAVPTDPTDPVALAGLTITWGRESTVDQPDPASCSFLVLDPPGGDRFDTAIRLGSTVTVWSVIGGSRVVVFGGRVTELDVAWPEQNNPGGAVLSVIAMDAAADLGNRYVGDEPWPLETATARVNRILALADPTGKAVAAMATRPAAVPVSRQDVDRRPAFQLLTELAETTASVLWTTITPAGAVLRFEDPLARLSGSVLAQQADNTWAPMESSADAQELDAAQVLRDPVHWFRDSTDLLTRASVRWLDQSTSPDTTERTVTLINTELEAVHGARAASVGTLLTVAQAASDYAVVLLATHQSTTWRSTGLAWDLLTSADASAATVELARALLDNTFRIGLPVRLVNLPEWTPTTAATALFVEGGTYTYEAPGGWVLDLQTVQPTGLGVSLTYDTTDRSIRVQDMDPDVTYVDMLGVGADRGAGAITYAQVPATIKYTDVPADISYWEARTLEDIT